MSEELKRYEGSLKKVPFVDPFTGVKAKEPREVIVYPDFDYNQRALIGVALDKDTGSTHVEITGFEDTDRIVQECKDDCGFVGMKKLIDSGQARPVDFMDDGKHGMDVAGLPDNVYDAYRAAMATRKGQDDLFAKLGISPVYDASGNIDMDKTEALINKTLTGIFKDIEEKSKVGKEDETK